MISEALINMILTCLEAIPKLKENKLLLDVLHDAIESSLIIVKDVMNPEYYKIMDVVPMAVKGIGLYPDLDEKLLKLALEAANNQWNYYQEKESEVHPIFLANNGYQFHQLSRTDKAADRRA